MTAQPLRAAPLPGELAPAFAGDGEVVTLYPDYYHPKYLGYGEKNRRESVIRSGGRLIAVIDFDKLTLIDKREGGDVYVYYPTLLKPILFNHEKMTLKRRLRFMRNYFRKGKYLIYYLFAENKGDFIGMITVTPGGKGLKLQCTKENDIILGPYFVNPAYRGRGFGKELIRIALTYYPEKYDYVYGAVLKSNLPSVKALEACGFEKYQEVNFAGISRKHVQVESGGEMAIVRRRGNL